MVISGDFQGSGNYFFRSHLCFILTLVSKRNRWGLAIHYVVQGKAQQLNFLFHIPHIVTQTTDNCGNDLVVIPDNFVV